MPRAGDPPWGRGVEGVATGGGRGGGGSGGVGGCRERGWMDGRTDVIKKKEKTKWRKEKKKNGKKTTTQDAQSHTENACKEQHKNLGGGGEGIRL